MINRSPYALAADPQPQGPRCSVRVRAGRAPPRGAPAKELAAADVPSICILDPDGDILRLLKRIGQARRFDAWPCYHTELNTFELGGETVGILGCVVGAPFAVLIAEELFASGCRFLLSLTSAGQIVAAGTPPYFVVIERALRDEGTSYHYIAPSEFAEADPRLVDLAMRSLKRQTLPVFVGPSWTTDAPFREIAGAIEHARTKGVLAVEMEAAALECFSGGLHHGREMCDVVEEHLFLFRQLPCH